MQANPSTKRKRVRVCEIGRIRTNTRALRFGLGFALERAAIIVYPAKVRVARCVRAFDRNYKIQYLSERSSQHAVI